MSAFKPLPKSFYARDTKTVAQDLLGKFLVKKVGKKFRVGKIVETEAYLGPHDLACHTSKGKTKRTATMFGPVGHAYVYLIYGMYHCINAVAGTKPGSAVLIRAIEPIANCEGKTSGPGLLCRTLEITRAHDGHDLADETFFITLGDEGPSVAAFPQDDIRERIVARPRVGVDYAKHWAKRKLRFYIKGNPFVSKP